MFDKRQIHEIRQRQETTFLATLIHTSGSTYQKAGAKKLFNLSGQTHGLISGGCLEQDIVNVARDATHDTFIDEFETTNETDRLFGSQVGCSGKIKVFYERVDLSLSVEQIEKYLCGQSHSDLGENQILIDPESTHFGARRSLDSDGRVVFKERWSENKIDESSQLYREKWVIPQQVVIVGAGEDIKPLHDILKVLNWGVQVLEHRADLLRLRKEQGWSIYPISDADQIISSEKALLLMSHNYTVDLDIFCKIAKLKLPYIGILGPKKRRVQMVEDAKKIYGVQLEDIETLHGPIGLPNMGRGPNSIALSIAAQLQMALLS